MVRDELVYRKELRLLDSYSVDVRLSGISADGTWIGLENTFRNAEGEVTAIVRSDGVWFDLDRRRPRAPPPDLHELLQGMPRSPNFRALPDRGPHGPAEPPGTSAGTSR